MENTNKLLTTILDISFSLAGDPQLCVNSSWLDEVNVGTVNTPRLAKYRLLTQEFILFN